MNRLAVLAALAAAALTQTVPTLAADGVEVPIEKAAASVDVEGHPLTSVVVTQCNLVVAVYMTMPDGRLLRFDKSANLAIEQLLKMAYTAPRSERVEVSCNDTGLVGYEAHDTKL